MRAALTLPDAEALSVSMAPLVLTGDPRLSDVSFLARGGMGSVYRAHDASLARDVAIKVVRPGRMPEELALRLRREAEALARLRHPNIVSLLRSEEREGHVLIVMELVLGQPLRRFIRKRHPLALVRSVMLACGEALCAAHAAGFAHRDFKPDNVLVREPYSPCVLDFGLARPLGLAGPEFRTLTRPGQVMGTATYMAPEQCRGERGDAASDQYSFGLSALHAFQGVLPSMPGAEPRALPEPLMRVLGRMLEEQPSARFATLAQALDALAGLTLPG